LAASVQSSVVACLVLGWSQNCWIKRERPVDFVNAPVPVSVTSQGWDHSAFGSSWWLSAMGPPKSLGVGVSPRTWVAFQPGKTPRLSGGGTLRCRAGGPCLHGVWCRCDENWSGNGTSVWCFWREL